MKNAYHVCRAIGKKWLDGESGASTPVRHQADRSHLFNVGDTKFV
jgi:hypothetical protein